MLATPNEFEAVEITLNETSTDDDSRMAATSMQNTTAVTTAAPATAGALGQSGINSINSTRK